MTDVADLRVVVLAVGRKGAVVLARVLERVTPVHVVCRPQDGDADGSYATMTAACAAAGVPVSGEARPDLAAYGDLDLVLVVGWQHLLDVDGLPVVVLHDSLLPRLRGFAPTVTALLLGDEELGVTAIRPVDEVDAGPVLGQRSWRRDGPVTIADALERQAELQAELVAALLEEVADGGLPAGVPQDHAAATWSLWRDADDGWIDWTRPAGEVRRLVDAVGHPYAGARTSDAEGVLVVREAVEVPDVRFELRLPGRVWRLDEQGPVVVCGEGMLRLERLEREDGTPTRVTRLRTRFGGAA